MGGAKGGPPQKQSLVGTHLPDARRGTRARSDSAKASDKKLAPTVGPAGAGVMSRESLKKSLAGFAGSREIGDYAG
jgi:hypothetical protein